MFPCPVSAKQDFSRQNSSVADGTPDLSSSLAVGHKTRDQARILALTTRIVSAHIAHNQVGCIDLPSLIQAVSQALAQVASVSSGFGSLAGSGSLVPAVPSGRSVFPDYIICLENGRRFRTLRRHLMAAFGLTPEQYRRRWSLPHDYPMIAPNYARNRSGVAKATGLGRRKSGAPSGNSHRPG